MAEKYLLANLFLLGVFTIAQPQATVKCPHYRDPDATKGDHNCCRSLYTDFRRRYQNTNLRLTNFLEKLRAWNCSQFEEECEERYFSFNRFTSLVYDRFCDVKAFEKNCRSELQLFGAFNSNKNKSGWFRHLNI